MTDPDLARLEQAVRAQFIRDVQAWLEWLDDEYDDADVPSDDITAQAVIDAVCDPRLVTALVEMPPEAVEQMRAAYEEHELLMMMLGRELIAMRGEALVHQFIPPSGAPEGMHR